MMCSRSFVSLEMFMLWDGGGVCVIFFSSNQNTCDINAKKLSGLFSLLSREFSSKMAG